MTMQHDNHEKQNSSLDDLNKCQVYTVESRYAWIDSKTCHEISKISIGLHKS